MYPINAKTDRSLFTAECRSVKIVRGKPFRYKDCGRLEVIIDGVNLGDVPINLYIEGCDLKYLSVGTELRLTAAKTALQKRTEQRL